MILSDQKWKTFIKVPYRNSFMPNAFNSEVFNASGLFLHLVISGSHALQVLHYNPDNKVPGANMGPTWVLSAPDGPHVGPMNLVIREVILRKCCFFVTIEWPSNWDGYAQIALHCECQLLEELNNIPQC